MKTFQSRSSKVSVKSIPGMPPPLNSKIATTKKDNKIKETKNDMVEKSSNTPNLADVAVDIGGLKISDCESTTDMKSKKVKALRKKLKEIGELSLKNVKELSEDQLVKLNKKSDIENELNALLLET